MIKRNVIAMLTGVGALLASTPSYASCEEEFPNEGFTCLEEDPPGVIKESTGFGVFVGPTPDLVLNIGIEAFQGLFGACITPLDRNGNAISECTVCDGTGPGSEEEICETNVFPVELRISQS